MTESKNALQLMVVRTTAVAAEALEALLEERGALGSAIERRRGARLVRLQAYFPADGPVPIDWAHDKLAEMHENGLPVGPAEVRVVEVHAEDWAESWKRHFHPLRVTERLWIVPSWEEAPTGAREIIRLDPGMAFGQGDHPTTRGCLEMLERIDGAAFERKGAYPTADVGTGTGVLAVRAVQLGFGPVEAFDTEEDAVRSARENVERNGVEGQVVVRAGTLPARGAGPYDLALANIFLSILVRLMPRLSRALRDGGTLIAAGLLADQEDRFVEAAEGSGFRVVDRICEPAQTSGRRWPVLRLRKGAGGVD